jgi:hypothetical protein
MNSSFDGDGFSTALGTENLGAGSRVSETWEHSFEYRYMINIGAVTTVSSAENLITPERNALSDTTIEATEYVKAWWDCFDPSRLGTAATSRASTVPRHYT